MKDTQKPRLGPQGGRLVRKILATWDELGLVRPISSDILCAISGGADSTALVRLLVHTRKLGARITLAHYNHGWRGEESDGDEAFVRNLAHRLGVAFVHARSKARAEPGRSLEDLARDERYAWLRREAMKLGPCTLILTAHTQDDLAETVLWRLATGQFVRSGEGILARDGDLIRPLLTVSRAEILEFLREEGQSFRHDSSNDDPRFLRAQLRRDVFPALRRIFPRVDEHLAKLALGKSHQSLPAEQKQALTQALSDQGVRLRASQWEEAARSPRMSLPKGWVLTRDGAERLILEKKPQR